MPEISLEQQLEKMRDDWDQRAKENAKYYVATGNEQWTDDEFFLVRRAHRGRGSPYGHGEHLPGEGACPDAGARDRLRSRTRNPGSGPGFRGGSCR